MNILMFLYLLVLNGVGYSVMWFDKNQAREGKRRVPEKKLFMIALIGGAVGSFIGMHKFRHKTKHWSFLITMPIFIVLNVLILYPLLFVSIKDWLSILAGLIT